MSALNVIQVGKAIHFFTDTAIYAADGTSSEFRSKVFAMPQARAAIGMTGPMPIIVQMPTLVGSARSLNDLVKDTQFAVKTLFSAIRNDATFGVSPDSVFTIIIGGFSEDGERQLWELTAKVAEVDPQIEKLPASRWTFRPELKRNPILNIAEWIADPEGCGLLALEDQRRATYIVPGWNCERETHIVGGAAQSMTVTFDTITTRIMKRWPDAVGRPIGALRGINSGSSSNYNSATSSGYVGPTLGTVGARLSGGTPTAPLGGTAANLNDNNTGTTCVTSAIGNLTGAPVASRIVFKIDYGSVQNLAKIEVVGVSQDAGASNPDEGLYYSIDGTNWTVAGTANISTTTTPTTFSFTGAISARYIAFAASPASWGTHFVTAQDLNGYAGTTDNMTLVTTSQTTDSSVSNVRVLIEYDNTAAPALNTDLTVEVTCNGGTNWTAASLSAVTSNSQGGRKVAETVDQACTAGTQFAARIKTLNNKNVPIYGVSLTVH